MDAETIYELWSDQDMQWVEIGPVSSPELELFLELWCLKNEKIFRKRPRYVHPVHRKF